VPASKRGWIGGLVIAVTSFVIGVGFASQLGIRPAVNIDWRALFALGLLPALATLLIGAWVPESPLWQIRNGLLEDAKRSLVASA
jgi:MFS transporter, putative metabolite:H+ symporter